ncbi:MAG: hypothetical protein ACR2P0_19320 [Acidimicrobiales bacterium]
MVTVDAREVAAHAAEPSTRRYTSDDLPWASELLDRTAGRLRVRRNEIIDTAVLPGLVALLGAEGTGVMTVQRHPDELEIAAVAATGVDPTAVERLLHAALTQANGGHRRVWTVVSNADFALQRSLQVVGFRLCAVRPGAMEQARDRLGSARQPAEIAGVPVRDELEFDHLI